jgi:hypothetical protein
MSSFIQRLDIYIKIPPTTAMAAILVKELVELLSILALATKQVKQGRWSEPAPFTYITRLNKIQRNF